MIRKRSLALVGLAVITLALILSCSLATEKVQTGTGVELYIGGGSFSRLLTVVEYDVTSLDITLRNGDEDLYSFTWYPYSSNNRIYVPILTSGTFDIDVTHNGVKDGETISVTENAKFRIKLGIITIIKIVPGMVGVIDVEPVEEPEPVDLTGYWVYTWFTPFGDLTPLYTYFEQSGNDLAMAHGFSGFISGDTMYYEGFMEDLGYISGTSPVVGNPIVGSITVTDNGEYVMDFETWMTKADEGDFGELTLAGSLDGTLLNVDTEWAQGGFSENDEEPHQSLDIMFFDHEYDVWIGFGTDASITPFGHGTFQLSSDGISMWARYLVNGEGFPDDDLDNAEGTLVITEWDENHVAGSFSLSSPYEMAAEFNVPFVESAFD